MVLNEIKKNKRSLIIWNLAFIFMIFASVAKFDTLTSSNTNDMKSLVDGMPKILKAVYGMANTDISSINGYLGAILVYILLMSAIFGVFLGLSLYNKEVKDRTSEFIFSKPFSRKDILKNKIKAAVILILIINIVSLLTYALTLKSHLSLDLLFRLVISELITTIFFMCLGVFLSICIKNKNLSQKLGLLVTLFSYLVVVLTGLYDVDKLNVISPIAFYSKNAIVIEYSTLLLYSVVLFFLSLVMIYLSFLKIEKIDIKM